MSNSGESRRVQQKFVEKLKKSHNEVFSRNTYKAVKKCISSGQ